MKTPDAARGKWRGILMALGLDSKALDGKHHPCPSCGGNDRFRFDNKDGNGSFICSQCGAGDGFKLLSLVKGWDFKTAASEVDRVLGNVQAVDTPARPEMSEADRKRLLNNLWKTAAELTGKDMASRYLIGRGLPVPLNGELRFAERCPLKGGGYGPAMVAMVRSPDGKGATIHRTFLEVQGEAVRRIERAVMPGSIPDGAAVRLAAAGEVLGIAEGIETALGAEARFQIPVWAALNATMLTKWFPPEGVREVIVFADNDAKYGGQAAAYALAHRLACNERFGLRSVRVELPQTVGTDWADNIAA